MNQNKKPSLAIFLIVAIVAMVLMPTLYALSAGPAMFLYDNEVISEETLQMVYAPLNSILDHMPERVAERFGDYVNWWEDLAASGGR